MAKVFIRKGKWQQQDIEKMTFDAISPEVMSGRNGFYVSVDGKQLGALTRTVRVYIDKRDDAKFEGEATSVASDDFVDDENDEVSVVNAPLSGDYAEETEDETIARINDRFEILEEMTEAAADGTIRGLIVTGSPGVGKSFGVEKTLRETTFVAGINGADTYEVVRGSISPIGLYKKLYQYRGKGQVLVFDDSDVVFFDQVSLGLLKAALDTSRFRSLSWETLSRDLEENNIPNRFEYEGSVIFITNMDLESTKSKQLKPHFDALISRSHYLDLTVKTNRDKFLRIKSLVKNGSILRDHNLGPEREQEILDFIQTNVNNLRELSLRTTVKIADIAKMNPTGWRRICSLTCCR